MTVPTVAVTCAASDQNGPPVAGATYTAKLNSTEIYLGFVVPELITGVADANGVCVLNLWPNALGVAGSLYEIRATNPDTGKTFLRTTVAVPNVPCNLYEILVQEPFPTLDAAAQVLIAAQGYAAAADDDRLAAEIAAAQALTRSADAALSKYNASLSEIEVEADKVVVQAIATEFSDLDAAIAQTQARAEDSEASRLASEAAATLAEAARDAAAILGKVYATTADGLAATSGTGSTNRYFSTPSPDSAELLILYLNSAGAAVEQKRYYSAAGVPFSLQSPAGFAMVFKDGQGKYAGGVQDDGTLRFAGADFDALVADAAVLGDVSATSLQVAGATLEALPGNKYVWGIRDGTGRLALAVKADGSVVIGNLQALSLAAPTGVPSDYAIAVAAEINHIISYGQSLSIGSDNFAMSKVAYGDSLKFSGGVRPSDAGSTDAVKYASLVPLIETDTPYGETPVFGACQSIRSLMAAENGIPVAFTGYTLLGSAPGVGGLSIASLSPGTSVYNRMIDDVDFGYLRSQELTKSYRCASMFWTQGEGDYSAATSKATYKTALAALLTTFRADVLTASGQLDAPVLIMGQTSSHLRYVYNAVPSAAACQIALAQLELSIEQAHAYLACPMYQFDFVAGGFDNPHLTNWSSKWYGAYLGLAYKRIVIDGLDWQPLRPLSATRQGVIGRIKFHVPVKPLVLDIVNVVQNSGYGFKLFAADGTTEIPLISVRLAGVDTVVVVAATAIPAGAILRYGFHTDTPTGHSGRLNGARGNLRDSQGDYIRFDPDGIDRPMHNWCVISESTFA